MITLLNGSPKTPEEIAEHNKIKIAALFETYFPGVLFLKLEGRAANVPGGVLYRGLNIDDIPITANGALDIRAMAKRTLFSNLIPKRKKGREEEWLDLQAELNKGPVDIVRFFLNKEDEKYAAAFNTAVGEEYLESGLNEDSVLDNFFEDIKDKGVQAYFEDGKLMWDFSGSVSHEAHAVYSAYKYYAHKNYTELLFGWDLDYCLKNPEKLVLLGPMEEVINSKLLKNLTLEDFVYHRKKGGGKSQTKEEKEEEEKKEQQNRKDHFLSKLGLDSPDTPLSILYYTFYITVSKRYTAPGMVRALRDKKRIGDAEMAETAGISIDAYQDFERGEKDIPMSGLRRIADKLGVDIRTFLTGGGVPKSGKEMIALGRKFLEEEIWGYRPHGSGNGYNLEGIEYILESSPAGKNKYIPTSLEKFIWQLAGQIYSPEDGVLKEENITIKKKGMGKSVKISDLFSRGDKININNYSDGILDLLPEEDRWEEERKVLRYRGREQIYSDKLFIINKLLEVESKEKKEDGTNKKIKEALGKTVVSNIKKLNEKLNIITPVSLEEPLGTDDNDKVTMHDTVKETKYPNAEEYLEEKTYKERLVNGFKKQFRGGAEKPFLDYVSQYINEYLVSQNGKYDLTGTQCNCLFRDEYCPRCGIDLDDVVMRRQFRAKIKAVFQAFNQWIADGLLDNDKKKE
jgi:transcriptional regulator with XRE-family HTH domain